MVTDAKKKEFRAACNRVPMSTILHEFMDYFIKDPKSLDYLKDKLEKNNK